MDKGIDRALGYLDPASLEYGEWVQIGMALKKEGYPLEAWDIWSQGDPAKYHPGECQKKWQGFGQTNSSEVGGGTIVSIAKAHGYVPIYEDYTVLDWNDEIEIDSEDWDPSQTGKDRLITDTAWLDIEAEENQLKDSSETWNDTGSVDEVVRYINLLFYPDDYVGIVYKSYEKDGKWCPADHGFQMKASELLTKLAKGKAHNGDVTWAICSYTKEGGAWIRPNPLDGKGYGNKNVSAYRYALIESDKMPVEQQIALIRELQLPVKVLVYSGGKSVHAIVHIDAKSEKEYRQRVDKLYAECKKNNFIVDEQNKNASRMSRLPGVWRKGQKQYIIAENIGSTSWAAWEDYLEEATDTLPEIEDLNASLDAPHELTPELIEGTLRIGHKMLIAGPSKAGKSFLLMELAAAIASGGRWLGKRCRRGKVLYINLEIDKNSLFCRFDEIFKAMNINRHECEAIQVWNLRGKTPPLNELSPRLIRRIREAGFIAIILDPIYKVLTGDENNARDMSQFCNQFDRIATETGAAVIYVHHHSKGTQIGKRSMDRASGSGVFARDPDALLDMVELTHEAGDGEKTPWRIEATLREFKPWRPVDLWFEFPIHSFDEDGELKKRDIYDGLSAVNEKKMEKKEDAKQDAVDAYHELLEWGEDGRVKIADIAARIGKSERTVRGYFKEMEDEFDTFYGDGRGHKATTKLRG